MAGGQENMSAAPHVLPNSRDGQRMGDWKLVDTMIVDGLWDVYNQYHMGITAENVAKEYGIDRDAQDALALGSQQKAAAAQDAGKFKDEIVPVTIPQKKGDPIVFDSRRVHQPEDQRRGAGRPAPAFDKAGSVTAGNASGLNDGAAAVVVMSAKKAEQLGLKPLAAHPAALRHLALDPDHGHGPGAGVQEGAAARRLEGLRRRPVRAERGLRGAGLRGEQGAGHRHRPRSTSTAAPSRSATRSVRPAPASW